MAEQTVTYDTTKLPQKELLANALESAANAIFITDVTGRIVWVNRAFTRLSGYSVEDALGRTPSLLKSEMQHESFYAELWRTILAGQAWHGVIVDRNKFGHLYTVSETISPLLNEQGIITHFIAIQHEMPHRSKQDETVHYLAYHDLLTGLPNRAFFLDAQQRAISTARRTPALVALLFLDLDQFKPVNDTYGHLIGDQLLMAVAQRLKATIRKSDTIARFGGDEFAILLPELPDMKIAAALARKVTQAIAYPFYLAKQKLQVSCSIGVAIYPTDGEDPADLLQKADAAMYAAKKQGGNSYLFYDAISSQIP